jgi:hypothetical protein
VDIYYPWRRKGREEKKQSDKKVYSMRVCEEIHRNGKEN